MDKTPFNCYECDSEFFVFPAYEDAATNAVSFCPYCGSEIEDEQYEGEDVDDDFFKDIDEE